MATKYRLSRETLALLESSGLFISSLWQIPRRDGRKLDRVALPGDPWTAQLFAPDVFVRGEPLPWFASFVAYAHGDDADEAVQNAIMRAKGMEGSHLKLEAAIGHLTESIRAARIQTRRA